MNTRSFLFLLASARRDGNTEAMTRHAAAHLPGGVAQQWLRLSDLPLPSFEDVRHSGDGVYPAPTGNAGILLDETLAATDIVIASPLYWYTLSATAKLYLDYWAGWIRVPGLDFRAKMREKTIWGVSSLSEEDPAMAEPLVGALRLSAEYFGARWGGVLLGHHNRPGEALYDTAMLERARTFFTAPYVATTRPASPTPTQVAASAV
jgi:hypothetical protein